MFKDIKLLKLVNKIKAIIYLKQYIILIANSVTSISVILLKYFEITKLYYYSGLYLKTKNTVL